MLMGKLSKRLEFSAGPRTRIVFEQAGLFSLIPPKASNTNKGRKRAMPVLFGVATINRTANESAIMVVNSMEK